MKKCSRCCIEKSFEEFNKNYVKKDGYQTLCRECTKVLAKNHYKCNKKYYLEKSKKYKLKMVDWYRKYKKELKCRICGEKHPACLDFHHTDPSKKEGNIRTMLFRVGKTLILEEIEKCTILCSNCHRKHHFNEKK